MKITWKKASVSLLLSVLIISGCQKEETADPTPPVKVETPPVVTTQENIVLVKKQDPGKVVALSFDDGPDSKWTPLVLDILKKYDIKATFFMVGPQTEKFPEVIQRMKEEGHDLANHTWSHPNLTKLTPEKIKEEIELTSDSIEKASGVRSTLCRAPYGAVNDTVKEAAQEAGCVMVGWSVDTRDWAGESVSMMMEHVKNQVHPGAIVLEHSFGGKNGNLRNTIDLLPVMIEYLKEQGYTFVKVSDLYEAKKS